MELKTVCRKTQIDFENFLERITDMKFTDARRYKKEVNGLYRRAFPAEERAPLPVLYHHMGNGKAHFYAVTDRDEFIGLVYTIYFRNIIYVFYLAIEEEKRGQGYGGKILRTLKRHAKGYTLILNIEDPNDTLAGNYEERVRRLGFYERNGFCDLHVKTNEAGVVYELLGTEQTVKQADYLALMEDFLGEILYKLVFWKDAYHVYGGAFFSRRCGQRKNETDL